MNAKGAYELCEVSYYQSGNRNGGGGGGRAGCETETSDVIQNKPADVRRKSVKIMRQEAGSGAELMESEKVKINAKWRSRNNTPRRF